MCENAALRRSPCSCDTCDRQVYTQIYIAICYSRILQTHTSPRPGTTSSPPPVLHTWPVRSLHPTGSDSYSRRHSHDHNHTTACWHRLHCGDLLVCTRSLSTCSPLAKSLPGNTFPTTRPYPHHNQCRRKPRPCPPVPSTSTCCATLDCHTHPPPATAIRHTQQNSRTACSIHARPRQRIASPQQLHSPAPPNPHRRHTSATRIHGRLQHCTHLPRACISAAERES